MTEECKTELKPCEVTIRFKIPKDRMGDMYKITAALNELGVHFDTGGSSDGENVFYDWEFDWSLKEAKVYFKKMKGAPQ